MQIHDTFEAGMDPRWQIHATGGGSIIRRQHSLHLTLAPFDEPGLYSSVQLTEYLPDERNFQFKPPVRLKIRAYSSLHPSEMRGSAGFGFWNHPLDVRQPDFSAPLGLGFWFAAPPPKMPAEKQASGYGLRALSLDIQPWEFTPLIPMNAPGTSMIRNPVLQKLIANRERKTGSLSECWLDQNLLTAEHEYSIEWRRDGAVFQVDNHIVHEIDRTPQHPLGFVARIDNQTSIVTSRGEIILGNVHVKRPQALVVTEISIEPL